MIFEKYYSCSTGNLYTVTAANGKRLMIECGVPWAKLEEALDFDLGGIEGCLISHSHMDHSKAVREVIRAGINVYASVETFEALGVATGRRTKAIADTDIKHLPSFGVLAFQVEHDCNGALGFVVREEATDEYLLFATDTCMLTQAFPYEFSIIAIACSYDKDILQSRVDGGTINETLAKRLLTSHPELQWVKRYLSEFCQLGKCREIHLLHCSTGNLDRERAVRQIQRAVDKACPFSSIKVR